MSSSCGIVNNGAVLYVGVTSSQNSSSSRRASTSALAFATLSASVSTSSSMSTLTSAGASATLSSAASSSQASASASTTLSSSASSSQTSSSMSSLTSASASSSSAPSSSTAVIPAPQKGFLRTWNVSDITFIAKGTYGKVYRIHAADGTPVVLKTNFISSEGDSTKQDLINEANNLTYLASVHITEGVLRLLDVFPLVDEMPKLDQQTKEKLMKLGFGRENYIIVVPYVGVKLEIMFTLKNDLSYRYDVRHVRYFAQQQLRTIGELRNAHIVHGDIKPANIAFTPDTCAITLLDFGSLAKNGASAPHYPTIWYRAPEYLLGFDTSQGDIWSLACVFYELGSGGNGLFPTNDKDEKGLLGRICKEVGLPEESYARKSRWFSYFFRYNNENKLVLNAPSQDKPCIPRLSNHIIKWLGFTQLEAQAFTDLILSMLKYEERPEPAELLKHPFFTQNYAASPPVKK